MRGEETMRETQDTTDSVEETEAVGTKRKYSCVF